MNGGYRSILGFWLGGLSAPTSGPIPTYAAYPDPFAGMLSGSGPDPFAGSVVSTSNLPDPFAGSVRYKGPNS